MISREEYEVQSKQLGSLQLKQEKMSNEVQHLLEIVTLLQNQSLEHSNTLAIHESLIQNKLDKSELPRLQALMKIILLYEEFKNQTLTQLEQFRNYEEISRKRIDELEINKKQHNDRITSIESDLSKFAHRKDIHIIAKELKLHSERLDKCAQLTQLETVRTFSQTSF